MNGPSLPRRTLLKGVGLGALAAGTAACGSIKGSGDKAGDKIVIGFVSPQTGPLAGFASGDRFVVDRVRGTAAYTGGFAVGGKTYDVEIVVKDTQSDPSRASQVARELILRDHADIILTSSTPETTNPVATVCEAQGIPCVSTVVPWEAWYFSRQADPKNPKPFTYTTMFFFGVDQFGGCFVPMWERVSTNKTVAGMFPNDADGNAFRDAYPAILKKSGYKWVDGGAYTDGTTAFSSMISKFKSEECEIFTNAPLPPDFNTMWRQAAQQGFRPKLATVAKVLLFPADTVALGPLVKNIATDSWWGPYMPNTSSLDGESAKQLAEAYQSASGKQWLQTLGSVYSLFEIAQKAFTSVDTPRDRRAVATALQKLNYSGISGVLDFTRGPVPGVAIQQPVGVQWKEGDGRFPYEMVVVDNSLNPAVKIGADLTPTNP
ncbi:ABC transporter substrate-binding protein [Sphaerisporangium corydalis]|uniref:ABC transporter substrate-binding protein n=1 Tax=Sphaerisporangium corydalis TaxID=1441875 RepID=A0ABV9EJ73_9ACTN|nr:ABC transporter substrate-binding protein [Sphaerisporangium corydalis]